MAGGRKGGPACATQAVHAPRLPVHRRSAAQTGRVLREGQTHQQRNGQTRTRKRILIIVFSHLRMPRLDRLLCESRKIGRVYGVE